MPCEEQASGMVSGSTETDFFHASIVVLSWEYPLFLFYFLVTLCSQLQHFCTKTV